MRHRYGNSRAVCSSACTDVKDFAFEKFAVREITVTESQLKSAETAPFRPRANRVHLHRGKHKTSAWYLSVCLFVCSTFAAQRAAPHAASLRFGFSALGLCLLL